MSTIYILKLVFVVLLELYIYKKTVQANNMNTQLVNNNLPIYLLILI